MKKALTAAFVFLLSVSICVLKEVSDRGVTFVQTVCEPLEASETAGVSRPGMAYASAWAEDTYIPEEYQRYCIEIGKIYNICPELLMAMIEQESSGHKGAVNSAGDTGLLQVNPKWHYNRMERLGVTDLYDPYSNILVAADYLAELFKEDEEVYLVLMKYNMPHSNAEELFGQGIFSEYALQVAERSQELERLHSREGGLAWERR